MIRIAALAFAAVAASCGSPAAEYGPRPNWSMALPDGRKVSAADFDGKVVIVDFWATWCPPCKLEIPGFIELQKQYGDQGLAMVGLSFDQDESTHAAWIQEQKLNYPSLFMGTPEGKAVVAAFEKAIGPIEGYPTTIVIDRKGRIVAKHLGYAPKEHFEKLIRPLF